MDNELSSGWAECVQCGTWRQIVMHTNNAKLFTYFMQLKITAHMVSLGKIRQCILLCSDKAAKSKYAIVGTWLRTPLLLLL